MLTGLPTDSALNCCVLIEIYFLSCFSGDWLFLYSWKVVRNIKIMSVFGSLMQNREVLCRVLICNVAKLCISCD